MAAKGKGGNTVAAVWEIAAPIAEQLGLSIWDIRFQKEGVSWYLRIYIDKEGGVGITDCENFSRAVDGPLDDADPIEQSYYLEVSSPVSSVSSPATSISKSTSARPSPSVSSVPATASANSRALSKATTTA